MAQHELRPGVTALKIGKSAEPGDQIYAGIAEALQAFARKRLAVALTELQHVLLARGLILCEAGPGWFAVERRPRFLAVPCPCCTPFADEPGLIWHGRCRRCANRAPEVAA